MLQQQPDVTANVVPSTEHQSNRILRIADVVKSVGLGRSTIYKLQQQGRFPTQLRLSTRSVEWSADDIAAWIESKKKALSRNNER